LKDVDDPLEAKSYKSFKDQFRVSEEEEGEIGTGTDMKTVLASILDLKIIS
jgi:hypothetical protein